MFLELVLILLMDILELVKILTTGPIRIGNAAGETTQGNYSVAIGNNAGQTSQGINLVLL